MSRLGDSLADVLARFRGTERSDAAALEHARHCRASEALAVRARLPAFVRRAPGSELLARVRDPRLREAVATWDWEQGNLILMGPSDIGKTTAAAVLFRRLLGRGVASAAEWPRSSSMQWFGAVELAGARREHPHGRGEAPDMVDASHASLLFLDDAGWDRDPQPVSEVLDARYKLGKPTIITTGRSRSGLAGHYGGPVVRRMLDAGGRASTVVDCNPIDQAAN